MKYIFIDTNIFLHFTDIEKIDWNKEIQSDQITLVIAPIVIDELDEKKVGNSKLGKRARKALQRIEKHSETKNNILRDNVYLEVIFNKPSKEIYERFTLNFSEQDHRLLASMLDYRETYSVDDIYICTNDVGPRIRARHLKFNILKLDNKYQLPPEELETEKELKKLKDEIVFLKSRIPKLEIRFKNGEEFLKLKKKEHILDVSSSYEEGMENLKIEYPKINLNDLAESSTTKYQDLRALNKPTREQLQEYNDKLEKFYSKYSETLKSQIIYDFEEELTYSILIVLNNIGNLPAENVDIHFHFPDGFKLIKASAKSNRAKLPESPKLPNSRFDFQSPNINDLMFRPPNISTPSMDILSKGPTIKKTNSYDVDFNIELLKHNYKSNLDELLIIFESRDDVKSFKVDYQITAANIPNPLSGVLNIIISK